MLCNLQYWGRVFCAHIEKHKVQEKTVRCTRGFIKKMLKWSRETAYRDDRVLVQMPEPVRQAGCVCYIIIV